MVFMLFDGFTETLRGFNLVRLGSAMPYCFICWIFDKYKALQWEWGSEGFWGGIKKYGIILCLYQEGFCFSAFRDLSRNHALAINCCPLMTQKKLTALFKLFSRHHKMFRHFVYVEV